MSCSLTAMGGWGSLTQLDTAVLEWYCNPDAGASEGIFFKKRRGGGRC